MATVSAYSFASATGPFTTLIPGSRIDCTGGQPIWVRTSAIVENNAQSRYDIGVWIATDGGNALNGSCNHYNLVNGSNLSTNLDGDQCGDLAQGVTATIPLDVIQVMCVDPDFDGNVEVGACVGFQQSDARVCATAVAPGGGTGFRPNTTPGTTAKCKCEPLVLPIDIKGVIRIDKVTNPAGDGQSFTFTPSYNGGTTFGLTDASAPNASGPLSSGTYTVTETVPSGWLLTTRACVPTGTATAKAFTASGTQVSVALAHTSQTVTQSYSISR